MIQELFGRTHIDEFLDMFSRVCVVEVGVISTHDPETGLCDVELYRVQQGKRIKLSGLEVLYIGNSANGFRSDIVGSYCLIFFPRTVVPSLRNNLVKTRTRDYDYTGAKVIPLATAQQAKLRVGFDSFGQFVMESDDFVLVINDKGIELRDGEAKNVYSFRGDTGFEKQEGNGHIVDHIYPDGTVELQYIDNNGKVAYRKSYKPDGTYKIQHGAYDVMTPEQEDDPDTYTKYAFTTTYGTDKSLSIVQQNSSAEVLNQIAVSSGGDITISNKGGTTISVAQDGTVSVTSGSDVSVSSGGDVAISSTGAISLSAGGKISLKNSVSNLFTDVLKPILGKLNGSSGTISTFGSPGSHNVVPGQITTELGKLNALME